jgi:predicted DNA-binding ribbon-helix-helix protein
MVNLTQTLYETDFNLWLNQTITQLKQGNLNQLDLENLVAEIEAMGRSEKRELISRLRVLVMHLLKWRYQPEKRSTSWIKTINEQRFKVNQLLKDSPSLKPYLSNNFDDCYQVARQDAAQETKLTVKQFPLDCPFSQEAILTPNFLPD